jgi:hypothetical protein
LPGFFERNGVIAGNFLTDFTKSVKHIQYVAVESIIDLRFEFYHLLTLWINMRHLFHGVLKPVKSFYFHLRVNQQEQTLGNHYMQLAAI